MFDGNTLYREQVLSFSALYRSSQRVVHRGLYLDLENIADFDTSQKTYVVDVI